MSGYQPAGRPSHHQYHEQVPVEQSHEQSQLISSGQPTTTARQGEHGIPIYTSTAANKYTPYDHSQGGHISNPYSTEYKNVDLGAYPVNSTDSHQPVRFIEEQKKTRLQRHPILFKAAQALCVFVIVGFLLTIPILITFDARDATDEDANSRRDKNLVFYIFVMLLTNWGIIGAFYVIAAVFPYVFRFVAHYVNPAHERYWRVFVMMRTPIVILFAVVGAFISVYVWIVQNDKMVLRLPDDTPEAMQEAFETIIAAKLIATSILFYFILWAGAFFLEKVLITYLTIHFHFRSHHHEILQSKKLVDALTTLYDYSYSIYPMNHVLFATEDWIIHNDRDSKDGHQVSSSKAMGIADRVSSQFTEAFGIVFGAEATSHWFSPRSTYALVGSALQHPAASAALAKRIWMSLVPENGNTLTVEDLKDALGPQRASKAEEFFQVLDENENGDIRLSELIPSIVEAGKRRKNIYLSMADITHVVNTLDWIIIGILAIIMLGLVLIIQVPEIKAIKEVIGFGLVGIGFVVGRTLNEFIQGAIFTILDHPYDVGDVVEIYTIAENVKNLLIVKRISLLYTVFEEVGSGKYVQFANMRSKLKKISNLSRSGKNKEAITLAVDFGTSFKDLELLKQELKSFITAPENSRDYYPDLGLRVGELGDLSKLELKISVRHKSNWSNEALRAARSSRFQCAIVAAVRRVPINKPGGGKTNSGEEGKPSYTVMVTEAEAASKREADALKLLKKRMDYVEPAKPAPAEEDLSSLSAEQIREAEEKAAAKQRKAEEKAAKEARDKDEEAEATIKMMGVKDIGIKSRGTSTGLEISSGQNQFSFISGQETGRRIARRY